MERFYDTNKVYVLGGTQKDFEQNWTKEGKGVVALLKKVIADGLERVSLTYDDIKELNKENRVACFVGNFIAENYINQGHFGALLTEINESICGVPSTRYEAACASGSVVLDAAITKLRAGDYDVAIVVGFELMKTVYSKIGGDYLGHAAFYEKECEGISMPFPKLFGKLADEYIQKYGLDEQRYMNALAKISVINYDNAKRNPMAQTRKWFMNYEQASHRETETNMLVGGRQAVSDCLPMVRRLWCWYPRDISRNTKNMRTRRLLRALATGLCPWCLAKRLRTAGRANRCCVGQGRR